MFEIYVTLLKKMCNVMVLKITIFFINSYVAKDQNSRMMTEYGTTKHPLDDIKHTYSTKKSHQTVIGYQTHHNECETTNSSSDYTENDPLISSTSSSSLYGTQNFLTNGQSVPTR